MKLSENALVGAPWSPNSPILPGKDGGNHYSQNTNPFLPDPKNVDGQEGGRKRRRRTKRRGRTLRRKRKSRRHMKSRKRTKPRRRMRKKTRSQFRKRLSRRRKTRRVRMRGGLGGSFPYPQSLLNGIRNIQYNVQGAWNAARGYPAPVNPNPTWQPIGQSKSPMLSGKPIDIQQAQLEAQQQAGSI